MAVKLPVTDDTNLFEQSVTSGLDKSFVLSPVYDPPGFSSAPARFLQYGLVVNPLTQTPIFKITCADSKSVDWVISAGNSLPRFGFNAFKALRWNQLPKPISLFSFFPRKKEGDAETIKHNLARSNPAINIRLTPLLGQQKLILAVGQLGRLIPLFHHSCL